MDKGTARKFGKLVERKRKAMKLTYRELAAQANMPLTTVYQILTGKLEARLSQQQALAKVVGNDILLPFMATAETK